VEPQLQTLERQWRQIIETFKTGFRDEEFLEATHIAFEALGETIEGLLPSFRELILRLLEQAPAMFAMLGKVIEGLLPVIEPLLSVFTTMADVLAWLTEHGLLKTIISFMIIRRMTPLWTASVQMIGAAITKTGMATVMLSQGLGAFVWAFFILMSEHRGWIKALMGIAIAIAAIVSAYAAFKAITGDITAPVRAAVAASFTALSLLAMYSFMSRPADEAVREEDYVGLGYQHGTRYAPRTGMTMVHEGEGIVTEPEMFFGGGRGTASVVIVNRGTIYGDREAMRRLIKDVMREVAEEAGF
jgi:hypothetical protein